MIGRRFLICAALFLSLIGAAPGWADEAPPTRVGRVSLAEGNVAARHPAKDWADTVVNHPISAGMAVRTAPQGRAVLRIGAQAIALSGGTELDFAQLDESGTRIVLRRGRVGVRLATHDASSSIEVQIPVGAVRLLTAGDYDIMAGHDGEPARLAVIDGRAEFAGKGLEIALKAGSAAALRGNDPVTVSLHAAPSDDFVAWWRPADRDDGEPLALRHVSAAMTGYETLDAHGSWDTVDRYGAVWFPRELPDGWAPFRQGHWRWIGAWGWTWIDDQPWGFGPSHYGRWVNLDGRWGWAPGNRVPHPAYIPAVVAFLGTAGVGLSYPDAFSPAVAWFPLGPGEVYWPSYTNDLAVIRRLNADAVSDVSTIGPGINDDPPADVLTGEYRNRTFASVVPRPVFVASKPVAAALVELPERRLANAPLLPGSPQISPPVPRSAVLAAAVGQRVPPKVAKAMHTLARILKTRDAPSAARAATPARSVGARAAGARPARNRVVGAPPRATKLRQAEARRR